MIYMIIYIYVIYIAHRDAYVFYWAQEDVRTVVCSLVSLAEMPSTAIREVAVLKAGL